MPLSRADRAAAAAGAPRHLCVAETQRQSERCPSGKGTQVDPDGGRDGELEQRSSGPAKEHFSFLWLVLSWRKGPEVGKPSVTEPVLALRGSLLQGLPCGFLHQLLQMLG